MAKDARVWRKRYWQPVGVRAFPRRVRRSTSTLPGTLMRKRAASLSGLWRSTLSIRRRLACWGLHWLTRLALVGQRTNDDYEAALDCVARALEIDPDSDVAYEAVGYIRACFNAATTDALVAGEKAITLCPKLARAPIMWQQCFTAILAIFGNPPSTNSRRNDSARLAATESMVDEARCEVSSR